MNMYCSIFFHIIILMHFTLGIAVFVFDIVIVVVIVFVSETAHFIGLYIVYDMRWW